MDTIELESITDATTLTELKRTLCALLRERMDVSRLRFPGAHPVALDQSNVDLLLTQEYVVCEKTDGERFLLMIDERGQCAFIDRKMHFYKRKSEAERRHHHRHHHQHLDSNELKSLRNSLLDGELVKNTINERVCFLVFDVLVFRKDDVRRRSYTDRMQTLHNSHPFSFHGPIVVKWMYPISDAMNILSRPHPYNTDGLIFTSASAPYKAGTCQTMLKWKPEELISIDFGISNPSDGNKYFMYVAERGEFKRYYFGGESSIELEIGEEDRQRANEILRKKICIVECVFNPLSQQWKVIKIREDKNLPNDVRVVENTWKLINNPISKQDLSNLIEKAILRE
jgi:hypothetical protein